MIHMEHSVAVFTKKIIQPGTYVVDRPDGTKRREFVSKARLAKMAATFKRMRDNGLNIPAPWRHDPEAKPLRLDLDQQDVDAYKNGGFWRKVWQDKDGAIYGELEVKNRSDAAKVGKSVVECSPRIDPKWQDGSGDEYEDAMTHIALVTQPVIRGQDNFVPVEEPGIALSMGAYIAATDVTELPWELAHDYSSTGVDSGGMGGMGDEGFATGVSGPTADVKTAVQALALAGIPLPQDTTLELLPQYLTVALQAYVAGKEQADDLGVGQSPTKPPKGSKEQRSTIVMSKELEAVVANQKEIGERLAEGGELTVEFLQGLGNEPKQETAQFSQEQLAMLSHAKAEWKKSYEKRIIDCVRRGQISPQIAKDTGTRLLETVEFAFSPDQKPIKNQLDIALETWEAIPEGSFLTGKSPTTVKESKADVFGETTFSLEGLLEEESPEGMDPPPDALTGKAANDLADSILDMAGIQHN